MKYLLGFCLCLTSTAFGVDDKVDASDGDIPAPSPTENSTSTEGSTSTDDNEIVLGTTSEEGWKPRLVVVLQAGDGSIHQFRTVREAYRDETDDFGAKPLVKYRERQVRVSASERAEVATLYCDDVSINVSKGDIPGYILECTDRVHIRVNGSVVVANSASFEDGKCELVEAKVIHDGTTFTAEKLTLELPIGGVVMNSFGRGIPAAAATIQPVPLDESLIPQSLPEAPSPFAIERDKPSRHFDREKPNTVETLDSDYGT